MNDLELNEWNQTIVDEFRKNNGQVGGRFAGVLLLLLHTIGAKSGKLRINPVAATMDGDRFVVIASNAGAHAHPDWYYNILVNPLVTIEVGTEQFQAQATIPEEPERTRLYNQMAAVRPVFIEYAKKAMRVIPVIVLTRIQ